MAFSLGLLKNLLYGSPEQRKRKAELEKAEQKAYWRSYKKARIVRARKRGYEAGKGAKGSLLGKLESISKEAQSMYGGAQKGASSYLEMFDLEPKQKKKR